MYSYPSYDYGYGYDYGYSSGPDLVTIFVIISLVLALVGTVLAFIFITPEKKRNALPKFFQIMHDIFNFKGLIIEKILKALYIFFTLFCPVYFFFMLFTGEQILLFLLSMILSPILIRVIFEFVMMAVLLVKNVISINNKLKNQNDGVANDSFAFDYSSLKKEEAPVAPVAPAAPVEAAGTFCTNCGAALTGDSAFCTNCGTSVNK